MPSTVSARQAGITLLETMVALTLGLAVVSVAFSIYTSNRSVFKQISGMARLQESARVAEALLSADLRQADGSLCRKNLPTTNVINSTAWWAQPAYGVEGFDSTSLDNRANQTSFPRLAGDSLTIWSGNADVAEMMISVLNRRFDSSGGANGGSWALYDFATPDRTYPYSAPRFKSGDLIVICDYNFALLAQAFPITAPYVRVAFNSTDSPSPGNCGAWYKASSPTIVALPACAISPAAYAASSPQSMLNDYTWDVGSMVGRLTAHHWYIGQKTNTAAGSINNLALRRLTINYDYTNKTILPIPTSEEIVENVSDMKITYLVGTSTGYPSTTNYVAASSVTDWTKVIGARIVLTLKSTDAIAVNASGVSTAATYKTIPITVAIRSRLPKAINTP